jgi:hypothetical protein
VRLFSAAGLALGLAWGAAGCDFRVVGSTDRARAGSDDLGADELGGGDGNAGLDPAVGDSAGLDDAGSAHDAGSGDAAVATLPLRIHVNGAAYSGGSDYPGSWAADPGIGGVCNGAPYTNAVAIRGTTDDVLFQSEMAGTAGVPLACAVHGLPAGQYQVTLLFAEIYFGPGCPAGGSGTGARVFDIYLEGVKVQDKLDLFATGHCAASSSDNKGKPVVKVFDVDVNDGTLDISMPASVNNAKISAIQILSNMN